MRDLDDTDARILRLLAEDGRRSYSEIGEAVDLSPPAVSDRVSRLRESGVIRRFTIDVDRSTLRDGTPVLVRLSVPPGGVDAVADRVRESDAVEHVFVTADGDVIAFLRVADDSVREWVETAVGVDAIDDYSVELVHDADWTPSVAATDFALTCDECGNNVTDEGVATRVGGSLHHFCCPTCEARYTDRYERLEEDAD
ncbi:AsnC family transcriptional regulator [Halobaculum sp. CBA1158]|uniref:AsnC family transcriptional regulator n=1 Tax=Halobaculum sp. CBA1158 TaxID=2904243 RepID=UPI001F185942|nr:AsnC family transcriptional regulator [Halobaculum sp. CBA1158]UIO98734.1 AsnC family transcriptional regulator [Halobaculum sp. CBA1158]